MGIYIKDMKMPDNCHECKFINILPTCPCRKMADEDFWNNVSLAVEGHKDCPLISTPPHGDLIDADKLIELCDIMANKCDSIGVSVWNQFKATVEWTPIVIPTEENK